MPNEAQDWKVRLINKDTGEGIDLPGIYQSMRVGSQLLIDRASSAASDGSKKTVQGFDDGTVDLTLLLIDQEPYTIIIPAPAIDYDAIYQKAYDETFDRLKPKRKTRGIDFRWEEAKEAAEEAGNDAVKAAKANPVSPTSETVTNTALDQLKALNDLYQPPGEGAPPTYLIISEHTRARGIYEVVWERLDSDESNADLTITVNLAFTEILPRQTVGGAGAETPTDKKEPINDGWTDNRPGY